MSDEQIPDAPTDAAALSHAADQVSGSADALTEQLALFRQELREAGEKAAQDVAAAEKKAAADVAAERKDRRRSMVKFFVVVVLDVVLSLVSIGLYHSLEQTNHKLQTSLRENYVTAQQQAETRSQVLCPLYTLLLTAVLDPAPRTPGTPAQQAQVAKAVETIEDGYRKLGCTPKLPLTLPSG